MGKMEFRPMKDVNKNVITSPLWRKNEMRVKLKEDVRKTASIADLHIAEKKTHEKEISEKICKDLETPRNGKNNTHTAESREENG